jgi:hypothetical protein
LSKLNVQGPEISLLNWKNIKLKYIQSWHCCSNIVYDHE